MQDLQQGQLEMDIPPCAGTSYVVKVMARKVALLFRRLPFLLDFWHIVVARFIVQYRRCMCEWRWCGLVFDMAAVLICRARMET